MFGRWLAVFVDSCLWQLLEVLYFRLLILFVTISGAAALCLSNVEVLSQSMTCSSLKIVKLLIHRIMKYFKATKTCLSSNCTNIHITCHTYKKHILSIHHNPLNQAGVVWYISCTIQTWAKNTKSQIRAPT